MYTITLPDSRVKGKWSVFWGDLIGDDKCDGLEGVGLPPLALRVASARAAHRLGEGDIPPLYPSTGLSMSGSPPRGGGHPPLLYPSTGLSMSGPTTRGWGALGVR